MNTFPSVSRPMNEKIKRRCWRHDLAEFRGLIERDRTGFLILLEWMENFRLRMNLEASREAAVRFWRTEVVGKQERETWQLEQWSAAISWYLDWLKACEVERVDHRSLPERIRGAVVRAIKLGREVVHGSLRRGGLRGVWLGGSP